MKNQYAKYSKLHSILAEKIEEWYEQATNKLP